MKFLVASIVSLSAPLGALEIAFYGTESFDLPLAPVIALQADKPRWVQQPVRAWADQSLGSQSLDAEALDADGQVIVRLGDLLRPAPFVQPDPAVAIFEVPAGTRALRYRVRGQGPALGRWDLQRGQSWELEPASERFGLGSTQLSLDTGAQEIALQQGATMGALSLPPQWSLRGRLQHQQGLSDDGRWAESYWLLEGPRGDRGILYLGAGDDPKDPDGIQGVIFKVTLQSSQPQSWALRFDAPEDGTWLLPYNQGLRVPQAQANGLSPGHDLDLRAGHFLSMPAWGWAHRGRGLCFWASSAEQVLRIQVAERRVAWVLRPSHGVWAGHHSLVISGTDGRASAWSQGLRRVQAPTSSSLTQSLRPEQVARLAGAVNIHYWKKVAWWNHEPRPEALAAEMRAAGLDRVLWSQKVAPEAVTPMAQLGWLLGSYENFQDLYPAETPFNWVNKDGWPEQAVHDRWGRWAKGWPHKEGGKTYYAGVRSSRAAVDYVRKEIDARKRHGQHAVFFDTTTASGPMEDWNPLHPMTRSEDLNYKRAQLAYGVGQGLIVGSESGHDGALGAAHYFEGMQSPWVGRFEDSGYDLGSIRPATEAMLKWNLSPRFRAPLFDLAYHDLCVGYEYWGDAANRLPEHWRRKDLFSVLYGQPQLWVMDEERWKSQKAQAIKSYRTWSPVVRHLFGQKMTDWKWIDAVGDVQETHWEDGSIVRVDFARDRIELFGPLKRAVDPSSARD